MSESTPKKETLTLVKVGGHVLEDPRARDQFLFHFASIKGHKILVHGGGKRATLLGEKMGIPQTLVNGRRITDEATLELVVMVYGGLINKQVVSRLNALDCKALGLTGADASLVTSRKRPVAGDLDFGWVGDVEEVDAEALLSLISAGFVPVFAPLTANREGQLLNTNADTLAQSVAQSLAGHFAVRLIFGFEGEGVLANPADPGSRIAEINRAVFNELTSTGVVSGGMIPKIENALFALESGVVEVIIGKAENLPEILAGNGGTRMSRL